MKNTTDNFSQFYRPVKGLIIYHGKAKDSGCFVESYDIDQRGKMVNAHPLSIGERAELADTLFTGSAINDAYLQSNGLMPANILYVRSGTNGFAVWYTPRVQKNLFFVKGLEIADGVYNIPPMVWKADRHTLSVYALAENKKPGIKTALFHAPFFNVYESGQVCMGTVEIDIDYYCNLETFMQLWEDYFFNSKFSHVLGSRSPVVGNIIQLWQSLLNNRKNFPSSCLIKHSMNIKNLIL